MREKHYDAVGPLSFLANGGSEGEIKLKDTCNLFVGQKIVLKSDTTQRVDLEIKRVLSATQIKVGRLGHKIDDFIDITAFLIADNATIRVDEQERRKVPPEVIIQSEWMREPINARRRADIDCKGDIYTRKNPKPVSGGATPEQDIKCRLLSAPDVLKDLTWAEIDGVRRITKIEWTSVALDAFYGQTIKLTRDFAYDGGDPYDLDTIQDDLDIS